MKRIDQLIGLSVIHSANGKKIGTVMDVEVDAEQRRISAVVIKPAGFGKSVTHISFEDVELIGDVSIIVKNAGKKQRAKNGLENGKSVYSTTGMMVGWCTNALMNVETGDIKAIELSKGYIDDITSGRQWSSKFSLSEDRIIMEKED